MTATPDAAFAERYSAGRSQVVARRIAGDLDTPVSAFLKLCHGRGPAFLLESVEGGATLGRYSVIGWAPDAVWRAQNGEAQINARALSDPRAFIRDERPILESLSGFLNDASATLPEGAPPMAAGVFGFLGYDIAREMERLPEPKPARIDVADAMFIRPTMIAVFDNVRHDITLYSPVRPHAGLSARDAYQTAMDRLSEVVARLDDAAPRERAGAAAAIEPMSNMSRSDYCAMVKRAKEHILAGDIFQAVLSQKFSAPFPAPPFSLYRALRRLNPSPFLFFLDFEDFQLVGSSPEILVRLRDGAMTVRPIAGTRPRGAAREDDEAFATALLSDPKERAEHLMLLDLGRNDVGRVCEMGSVRVREQFVVERYSHVMHLVSTVEGRVRADVDPLIAVAAGFPAGTVSGAPKIRAMEIIADLEPEARGPYAGAVGYFSADGSVDTCITLRTALIKDGVMHVQAGAGVVLDSDPETEHQECVNKAGALFAAAAAALSKT